MKTSTSLFLVSLAARHVAADRPFRQWDPATAPDCIGWYDHLGPNRTCEEVRDRFSITPEQFHEWNPSVGLDCKPWHYWQSYCIVTKQRLIDDPPPPRPSTTVTTKATTTTSTTSTLGPSPTAWADRGCYVEDPELPLLDENMSGTSGDPFLTIEQCKYSCYIAEYPFAGVQEGNQCWCGTYVGGPWAQNQSDCNIPCTGDKTRATFCGGKGLLNIFQALENQVVSSASVTPSGTPTDVGTGIATTSTASSGAMRNIAMFG